MSNRGLNGARLQATIWSVANVLVSRTQMRHPRQGWLETRGSRLVADLMHIRSFIIAYALVLAILLFADRRPHPAPQDRYSHVVDLTAAKSAPAQIPATARTEIVAPGSLIPGTWAAGED